MIASEMAPLAKVGGLADVVGALSPALVRLGHDVRVVLPRYAVIDAAKHGITPLPGVPGVSRATVKSSGADVTVYLVESQDFFGRPGIYNDPATGDGYRDNARRFLFFSRSALDVLKQVGFAPDVVHCHDHQTAFIPAWLHLAGGRDPFFAGTATMFTVHNLGYQGLFPPDILAEAGIEWSRFYPASPFEFFGQVNFMKVGLCFADLLTTVSPTYAKEICTAEQGSGLEGVLTSRGADLSGVLNGIDADYWNPAKDPHIKDHYTGADTKGKAACRSALLKKMGLKAGKKRVPVIGMISRLAEQKGFDLLEKALDTLMKRDLILVVLGAGEERYTKMLTEAQKKYPEKVALRIGFDEALAHLIEAGSDMFLMPSRYEPCGLNQMYSLAYGTVPVVRATGGLADTVREQKSASGPANGFVFDNYDATEMLGAVDRALKAFGDKKQWSALMTAGMSADASWKVPATTYVQLYERAVSRAHSRVAAVPFYA